MAAKLLCYLIFTIIETLIILGAIVVVTLYYLPMVAIKGVAQGLGGKSSQSAPQSSAKATEAEPRAGTQS